MARLPSRARTADSDKGSRPVLASSVKGSSGRWLVSVEDSSLTGSTVVGSNVVGSTVEGSISHGSSVAEKEY